MLCKTGTTYIKLIAKLDPFLLIFTIRDVYNNDHIITGTRNEHLLNDLVSIYWVCLNIDVYKKNVCDSSILIKCEMSFVLFILLCNNIKNSSKVYAYVGRQK